MEQQNTENIGLHLKSVDDGSSYQTFQDNTTLLGQNDDGHSSGVGSGSGSRSASRMQLVGNDNSDSKVKDEEVGEGGRQISDTTTAATVSFVLKTISICLTFFCTSLAETSQGLCLVHLSLIFDVSIDKFGINFFLMAIAGALGAILSIFTNKLTSYEVQLGFVLTIFVVATSLSPWFNFATYCVLQFLSFFGSGYINSLGYPYIVRTWGDRGYLRGAALQLFTLMYTLGIAAAPFIVEPFLVTLPNSVDTQTCDEVSAPTFNVTRYAGNAVMHDTMMTSPQQQQQPLYTTSLILTNDDITQGFSNSSVLSYQQDVGLARWTFLLACVGDIIAILLLAAVYLMSQQTFTSSESRSDNDENASSKLAASVALVCAMFATLFFWASIAGSFTYYLQTYAIVGLGWDKSDASYLNAICAAGQIIGRLAGILLSAYVSRRPVLSIVVLLLAGVGGLLLMMMGDLWSVVQGVVMRVGVFVAGAAFATMLPLIFIVVDQDYHLDVFKSAILVCGEWVGYEFGTIIAGLLLCDYGSISFILILLACSAFQGIALAALTQVNRLKS